MSIEYTFWHGSQSIEGEALDTGHEPRLRARVDRDSHNFQSSAVVSAWTAEHGWAVVTLIPIAETRSAAFSYAGPKTEERETAWQDAMRQDLDDLLSKARRVFAGE